MITYFPDTSVLIDALNGKRGRHALLRRLVEEGHLLATSPIQVTEIYTGVRPHEEAATEDLLRSLEYYEITWGIARHAGILKRDYARRGVTLTLADATIAAVALAYQLTLITDNSRHYPMKDLRLYPLS